MLETDVEKLQQGNSTETNLTVGYNAWYSAGFYTCNFAKKCEYVNTMVSFIWLMVGFYWVVSGGEILLQSAPRLYWLLFHLAKLTKLLLLEWFQLEHQAQQ